jgi:hypothetical protein
LESIGLAGDGAGAQRSVEALVEGPSGELEKRGQQPFTMSGGFAPQAEFSIQFTQPGVYQGIVRIAGADALSTNDARYFTVEVQPNPKVLIVAADPHHAVYLKEAISPRDLPAGAGAGFIAKSSVVPMSALEEQSLFEADVVCLLDPPPLPAPVWQRLADFVRQGGGLGIFLGRRAIPISSMNEPAPQDVLPGLLKRQWREATFLAPDDYQHPILAAFQPIKSQVPWQAFPVYKFWQFDEPTAGVNVVLRYATGHPAMFEESLGEGRIVTLTTPISDSAFLPDRWNLLPTGSEPWPYVVLASETVAHLAHSGVVTLNYRPGETARVATPRDERFDFIALEQPNGQSLRQALNSTESAVAVRATDQLGNYRLRAGGEEGGLDRGFSVNLSAEQTRLNRVDPEVFAETFGEERFSVARDKSEIDRSVNVGRVGRELFPYAMVLLATVLLLEHVLSNRFYRDAT